QFAIAHLDRRAAVRGRAVQIVDRPTLALSLKYTLRPSTLQYSSSTGGPIQSGSAMIRSSVSFCAAFAGAADAVPCGAAASALALARRQTRPATAKRFMESSPSKRPQR